MLIMKPINKVAFTLLTLSLLNNANAQAPNNSIYLELGGNAGVFSINYERIFDQSWGLRAGLGGFWFGTSTLTAVPLLANKYWGNANSSHKFETGVGLVYLSYQDKSRFFRDLSSDTIAATASIGYRYLPKTKGMTFKIAFTPIINSSVIVPWVGISVGHNF